MLTFEKSDYVMLTVYMCTYTARVPYDAVYYQTKV